MYKIKKSVAWEQYIYTILTEIMVLCQDLLPTFKGKEANAKRRAYTNYNIKHAMEKVWQKYGKSMEVVFCFTSFCFVLVFCVILKSERSVIWKNYTQCPKWRKY